MVERGAGGGGPRGLRAEQHLSGAAAAQGDGAKPVEQKVTRYFEATGNAAAVNSANLVARVQGFLTEINYTDGTAVKKGQHLFTIEPEPYQLKLQQAQAAEAAAQASLKQTEADFERQQELVQRQAASKAAFDAATAKRDTDKAKVLQAQADTKQAQINLDYTKVVAPFDGIVTARQVSVGELVGGSGTQVLATIVQLDPIYVNFNASERDVLHVRDMLYKRGTRRVRSARHRGRGRAADRRRAIRTRASSTTSRRPSTRAPARSRRAPNCRTQLRLMLPGFFVRVRVPLQETSAMLVPSVALGSDQGGRYVLVVNGENVDRAAQGRGRPDGRRDDRDRERPESRRPRGDRRHPARRSGTEGRSADARPRRTSPDDLPVFHRPAGPRQRPGDPDDRDRRGRAVVAARRAISRRDAADRAGADALSGRERAHPHRHRGAADRAAGQRRREHDLHAVDEHVRRHLHARSSRSRSAPTSTSRRCWCRTACRPRSPRCPMRCRSRASTSRSSRPRSCRSSR